MCVCWIELSWTELGSAVHVFANCVVRVFPSVRACKWLFSIYDRCYICFEYFYTLQTTHIRHVSVCSSLRVCIFIRLCESMIFAFATISVEFALYWHILPLNELFRSSFSYSLFCPVKLPDSKVYSHNKYFEVIFLRWVDDSYRSQFNELIDHITSHHMQKQFRLRVWIFRFVTNWFYKHFFHVCVRCVGKV